MHFLRFSDVCANGFAAGKRVFIRADLNVPQNEAGEITEDTRIRASVPCIQMALNAGAAVMVTSHLGRPTEGEFKPEDSLAPVAKRLGELLGREGGRAAAHAPSRALGRAAARSLCWRGAGRLGGGPRSGLGDGAVAGTDLTAQIIVGELVLRRRGHGRLAPGSAAARRAAAGR
jgi:hypothetical protein